ncbi:MAG TPA: DUF1416 domain-containing protein [Pseudonocardiaceae bacterium]
MSQGCGAPAQSTKLPAHVDLGTEVVLAGKVTAGGSPVGGAYVRLLNDNGDFVGEVVTSDEGDFRFFAAPGDWTLRALHRTGNAQQSVHADGPGLHEVAISVA